MSLLTATIKLDIRLQARNRLYAIGIVTAILLGLAGRFFFREDYAGPVLAVFFVTGLGLTTYFFAAALVLLEKGEGTLAALRSTPLSVRTYMLSKGLTLTVFALIESLITLVVAFGNTPLNPVPLLAGLVSLGLFYTFIGLGQVAPHHAITSFLVPGAMLVSVFLQLPCLGIFEIGPSAIWYLVPTQGPLLCFVGAYRTLARWQWVYTILLLIAAPILAAHWAERRLQKYVWNRKEKK